MASKRTTSLKKPESIKADAWKAKKWDELVKGHVFVSRLKVELSLSRTRGGDPADAAA